nr:hypothetical protein [Fodinicola feengrottensis]
MLLARHEWQRAAAAEAILSQRHRNAPPQLIASSTDAQVRREDDDERRLRRFYADTDLLSQPDTLRRYLFAPMPDYLAPLAWYGLADDLTSAARVDQNALRYVAPPSDTLPYFERAKAYDPLCGGLIHEGVHAQQQALSWRHPNPIRRHHYDSLPTEGIAFYHEEMTLLGGLFDDRPHSATRIANFLRLRALRAELDVLLALGEITLAQASDRLVRTVRSIADGRARRRRARRHAGGAAVELPGWKTADSRPPGGRAAALGHGFRPRPIPRSAVAGRQRAARLTTLGIAGGIRPY